MKRQPPLLKQIVTQILLPLSIGLHLAFCLVWLFTPHRTIQDTVQTLLIITAGTAVLIAVPNILRIASIPTNKE